MGESGKKSSKRTASEAAARPSRSKSVRSKRSKNASKLTPKQARFVGEYLVDLNATQAAIRAGYSEKTAYRIGADNIRKPQISEAIAAAQANLAERTSLSQEYVLANLEEVVERCMQRAPVMVRRGRTFEQLIDDEGRHVWRFDAKGATAALTLLGKHLGIFVDRHQHTGPGGGPLEFTFRLADG